MYMYTYIYIYKYWYINIYTYIYMHVMYISIFTYIYTHMMYIYIHTYAPHICTYNIISISPGVSGSSTFTIFHHIDQLRKKTSGPPKATPCQVRRFTSARGPKKPWEKANILTKNHRFYHKNGGFLEIVPPIQ